MTTEKDDPIVTSSAPPRTVSGRLFVMPFVVVLLCLGALMFAVAFRFQTIMACLEEVRSLWPNASQELRQRYEGISELLDTSQANAVVKQDWAERTRDFELASQFDRQSIASMAMEFQIGRVIDQTHRRESDFKLPGISKLSEAENRRKQLQSDMIGWLTVQGLRLKLPPIYEPLANNK